MRFALLIIVTALVGCDNEPTSPLLASGTTDQAVYQLPDTESHDVPIGWVYTNRSSETVWIHSCRDPNPGLQQLRDGEWVGRGGPRGDCGGTYQVNPGEEIQGTLGVSLADLNSSYPPPEGSVTGDYRLIWTARYTDDLSSQEQVPENLRISNQFEIR